MKKMKIFRGFRLSANILQLLGIFFLLLPKNQSKQTNTRVYVARKSGGDMTRKTRIDRTLRYGSRTTLRTRMLTFDYGKRYGVTDSKRWASALSYHPSTINHAMLFFFSLVNKIYCCSC